MADGDVNINMKMTADTTGGKQTEEQVDRIRDKNKKLAEESKRGGETIAQSFGKVTRAANLFRNVLTGFGLVGIFTSLANSIGTLIKSFGQAEKEAAALDKAARMEEAQKAVKALADHYRDLTKAMAAADVEMARLNELQEKSVQNSRALQDAQLAAAEAREISAVDQASPTASAQIAAIRARYAAQRGDASVERRAEDIKREETRLRAEAGKKLSDAGQIEGSLKALDKQIRAAERRSHNAWKRSTSSNEEDVDYLHHPFAAYGTDVKRIVTLDWGSSGEESTPEGDALRAEARQEWKEQEAEVKRLKADRAARADKAKGLRDEAAHLRRSADTVHASLESIKYEREVAVLTGTTGIKSADVAVAKAEEEQRKKAEKAAKREAQHAADMAFIAGAGGREADIQGRIDAQKARLAAAERRSGWEEIESEQARQSLMAFDAANGGRPNRTGVQAERARLEKKARAESEEAKSAKAEFDQVESEVATILKQLKEEMRKFQSELRKAESREQSYKEGS